MVSLRENIIRDGYSATRRRVHNHSRSSLSACERNALGKHVLLSMVAPPAHAASFTGDRTGSCRCHEEMSYTSASLHWRRWSKSCRSSTHDSQMPQASFVLRGTACKCEHQNLQQHPETSARPRDNWKRVRKTLRRIGCCCI